MEARSVRPRSSAPVLGAAVEIGWLSGLRIALGALFISVFFENLNKDLYTSEGYSSLIDSYRLGTDTEPATNAPGPWKDFMGFIADNASVFAPLQAGFELALGIALVLGIATGVVALVAGAHLTALWISELGIFWVWELLSLMILAFAVGLAALPQLRGPGSLRQRLLGYRTFGYLPMGARFALAVAGGLALAGAIVAGRLGGSAVYEDVAIQSGLAFTILLALTALLDELRPSPAAPTAADRGDAGRRRS